LEQGLCDVTRPHGIAVTLGGSVYMTDSGNRRAQRFDHEYAFTWRGEYNEDAWLAGASASVFTGQDRASGRGAVCL